MMMAAVQPGLRSGIIFKFGWQPCRYELNFYRFYRIQSVMSMNWTPPIAAPDSEREPRTSKLVSIDMASDRHARTRIVIRNISSHGLGARADIDLLPCERVTVFMPDGTEIGATVRWARKNTFGLSLDQRISASFVQVQNAPNVAFQPRDEVQAFHRLHHSPVAGRSGFHRSHRDEVLKSSHWTND